MKKTKEQRQIEYRRRKELNEYYKELTERLFPHLYTTATRLDDELTSSQQAGKLKETPLVNTDEWRQLWYNWFGSLSPEQRASHYGLGRKYLNDYRLWENLPRRHHYSEEMLTIPHIQEPVKGRLLTERERRKRKQ